MVRTDRTQKIVTLKHKPSNTKLDLFVTGYDHFTRAEWRKAAINNLLIGMPLHVHIEPSEYSLAKIL